ncbi:kelch repeat-containing protein [Flagellimonas flava]|uniref:kelch repeat-containing protein n=1 Tax=Flagellimonas flava TaxID=570519 RepID=UPI003D65B292
MKVLKSYSVKKWLIFGLPILAMCLVIACSKDDGKTDDGTGGSDDDPTPKTMTFTSFSPVEGERGSTVELTGTNFSTTASENTVKFGTVDAEVTDATSGSLTVTVPDNATSGTISVSTGATTVISTNEFEVYEPAKWTQVKSYPNEEGRSAGVSFVINDIIYHGLGSTFDHLTEHQLWSYIPELDDWFRETDFPNADDQLTSSAVFVIGNKAYIVGGSSLENGDSSEVWEYDPTIGGEGGMWTLMETPFPGTGKVQAVGFSIDGKGYIAGGGYDNGEFTQKVDEVWMYDPTNDSWTEKMDFPGSAFTRGLSFVVDSKAYVHLGRTEEDGNGSNEFWEYSPSGDTWVEKASIPGKRSGAFGFAMDGKVYIGYGSDYDQNQHTAIHRQDFMVYNPTTNDWTDLITPEGVATRSGAISHAVNGIGYMGLGSENGVSTDFWKFEPRKRL